MVYKLLLKHILIKNRSDCTIFSQKIPKICIKWILLVLTIGAVQNLFSCLPKFLQDFVCWCRIGVVAGFSTCLFSSLCFWKFHVMLRCIFLFFSPVKLIFAVKPFFFSMYPIKEFF